jgi:hypothetical protein
MKFNWRALHLAATLVLVGYQAESFAACPAGCKPARKSNYENHQYSVAFGVNFTSTDQNAIFAGMDYWNSYFISGSQAAPFQYTAGQGRIVITVDRSMSGSGKGANYVHNLTNGYGTIYLNPDYLGGGYADLLRTIFDHEFGHGLGFDDVGTAGCSGQTAMYTDQGNGPVTPVGSTITDCDKDAATSAWPPPPPPPPPPPGPFTDPSPYNEWAGRCVNCDPLILDLRGDGVQTTNLQNGVSFDIDGDGTSERIAWTDPASEDAFLWVDRDGNHHLENGSELFGVGMRLPSGELARDGFEALAAFDRPILGGLEDGVIDPADWVWNRLRLWLDENHNGVCEPGESRPIHAYGVLEIRLSNVADNVADSSGNLHGRRGNYLRRVVGDGAAHERFFALDSVDFRRGR